MNDSEFDIVIVGAGIAGAGLAAALGEGHRIVILEQEDRPGYHSTGRSAAIFIRNYGNAPIRSLTAASAPLFEELAAVSPAGPILSPRGLLYVSDASGLGAFDGLLAESDGLERIGLDAALAMVPKLRSDWLAAAAYEQDAQDIDVAALHELFLRRARAAGAVLKLGAGLTRAERRDGLWHVETAAGPVRGRVLVNAAGAWADTVAVACGVPLVGLVPCRRSMAVLPGPEDCDTRNWPLVADVAERWYFKTDAGRLFVSPADEDPVEPQDAFADDMVLAEGLDRFEQAVAIPVTRLERSWAGLRTFAPDRTPVVGYDRAAEGFFWLAGQGGYGIQTSPGLSALAATLIRREPPPAALQSIVPALSPDRFRS
ncbi:MAG: FAD-binding oxidoreductase [Rhizobiaceae bacterium]|nr:FAD-binding oxidoreductase [Rhizobiaceae bacterium]